jgi:hypothetical protein
MNTKNRNETNPSTTADTQDGAVATLPEPTPQAAQAKPFDPTDVQFFLDNMRVSDKTAYGREPYIWKDKAQSKFWRIIWRPAHKVEAERAQLESRGIVLVQKGSSIYTVPFTDLLEDASFNPDTQRVHSNYRKKDEVTGTYEAENVLYLQPVAAAEVMMRRTIERVKEKTERKPEKRSADERDELLELARTAGARAGAVSIEAVEHDGVGKTGWDAL